MRTEDSPSLDDILGTAEALKRTRLSGKGPAGRLPLTEEMLRDGPSGNIFGMTQAAAMGWDPAKTDREAFMIVTTMMSGRKEKKRVAAMLGSLKRGDRVQTLGGMIGTVHEVKEDSIVLMIDDVSGTKAHFSRTAVHGKAR